MTRIGSLCSGYGGLDLGLMSVVGGSVAWHVEYDKHPSAVLDARFPGVPNYGDVTTTDWAQVEPVDWLTAGYPCQPFSHAGKRKGSADERHLWPFVADAIGVLRPGRVLLENVAGHVSLGLDAVLWDLAALGYDTTWGVVRAADAGAPHGRARVFILAADTAEGGRWGAEGQQRGMGTSGRVAAAVTDASGVGRGSGAGLRESEPRGIGRGRPDHDDGEAPADATGNGRDEGWPEPAGLIRGPDAAERSHDVPANADGRRCQVGTQFNGAALQAATDRDSSGRHVDGCGDANGHTPRLGVPDEPVSGYAQGQHVGSVVGTVRRDRERRAAEGVHGVGRVASVVAWGQYEPAIRRWEHVTGRAAPRPTEPGRTGERLSPRFVEWLMGLPDGWVTDLLPRSPALKALGNGVVPQQAALALRTLLQLEQVAA